jgi:D-alanyl-lipoteichoic acid acyltransferase DltB (MBOAT superfamily)
LSFDTITFWLFFAFAWTAWRLLPFGLAKSATLASSFLFYAWWNPWLLPLIALSAGIDFHVGQKIHAAREPRTRRAWLLVSVCSNLSILGFFKYAPLLVRTLAPLLASAGIEARTDWSGWVIPVGISFYTFQSLSYSIDIYRERLTPTSSLRDFMLFVAFFPQLVAGPIVRARDLLPQFARRRRLHPRVWQTGAYYVIVGLFLKSR